MAQFGTHAGAEHQGKCRKQRGHCRHQDGTESQQAGLVDGLAGTHALGALRIEREVNHHDGVLENNADQQHDADHRDDSQVLAVEHEREERTHTGGWQCREDRHRVHVALVEHAQHDVHGDNGRKKEEQRVVERSLEGERRALETRLQARGNAHVGLRGTDRLDRIAQRCPRCEVEGNGRSGKLPEVIDGKRRGALDHPGHRR